MVARLAGFAREPVAAAPFLAQEAFRNSGGERAPRYFSLERAAGAGGIVILAAASAHLRTGPSEGPGSARVSLLRAWTFRKLSWPALHRAVLRE